VEELARETNLPEDKVDQAMQVNTRQVSVDAPLSSSDDGALIDIMSDEDDPATDSLLVKESLRDEIARVLKSLSERERRIVKAFYGIGEREMTLEEIGTKYGLTRERVRQIKEKAIRKLRANTISKQLKAYLGGES